jgi:hypothetical protein
LNGLFATTGRSLRVCVNAHRQCGSPLNAVAALAPGAHRRYANPLSRRIAVQRLHPLPIPSAETYTALSTTIPAVKFNKVYLTPCTAVPSSRFAAASDKRCSFGQRP